MGVLTGGFLDYVITCFLITKLRLWEQWTYFQDNFGLEIFCPYNLRARAIQNPPFQGMESVHQDDSGNTE
jgi:hypothetical protein